MFIIDTNKCIKCTLQLRCSGQREVGSKLKEAKILGAVASRIFKAFANLEVLEALKKSAIPGDSQDSRNSRDFPGITSW